MPPIRVVICLKQWFPTESDFGSQGKLGNLEGFWVVPSAAKI